MPIEKTPIGRKAVAYYNPDTSLATADNAAAKSWLELVATVEIGSLFDVNYATSPEYADTTTRKAAAGGFSSQKPILTSGEITFDLLWNPNDDTATAKLIELGSAADRVPVTLGFLDYPHDDPELAAGDVINGLVGNFFLSFTKAEAIRDVQKASFTATSAGLLIWYSSIHSA